MHKLEAYREGGAKHTVGNIAGITAPAIARLAHKAGVKTIGGLVYEETRGILNELLRNIIKHAVLYAQHQRHTTVSSQDIKFALENHGIKVYSTDEEETLERCQTYENHMTKKKIKHHDVIKEIRFLQNQADCVYIAKAAFKRFVVEIGQKYASDLRWSEQGVLLLQATIEAFMIDLFQDAVLVAIHAGRETVMPKDLGLVRRIRKLV